MYRIWAETRAFIESGGDTMWAIFFATNVMWVVTLERYWYLRLELPRLMVANLERARASFEGRDPWLSARSRRIVSEARLRGETGIWLVRTMVALCPLLGLLGTVLGMLEVFDVMSVSGNSNPRAMAAGVSQATITTLAGMASALSGIFFVERLGRKVDGMVTSHREALGQIADSKQGHGSEATE